MLSNAGNLTKPENFRAVFFDIKKKTNEMLSAYNDVDFLENPSVDINTVAIKNGIIRIDRVPGKDIPEKNATLKNRIIKVKEEAAPDKQNFWIAHELEHHLKNEAKKTKEHEQMSMPEEDIKKFLKNQDVEQVQSVVDEVAAAKSDYGEAIKILKKNPYFTNIAKPIAEKASINLGKNIPEDKAFISIAKLIFTGNSDLKDKFISEATDDLYNEEIADYFAANLLVPIERFMLWEDKNDEEIAAAFKVSVECIKKRREEIEMEVEFLSE